MAGEPSGIIPPVSLSNLGYGQLRLHQKQFRCSVQTHCGVIPLGRSARLFSELTPKTIVVDTSGSGEGMDVHFRLICRFGQ